MIICIVPISGGFFDFYECLPDLSLVRFHCGLSREEVAVFFVRPFMKKKKQPRKTVDAQQVRESLLRVAATIGGRKRISLETLFAIVIRAATD